MINQKDASDRVYDALTACFINRCMTIGEARQAIIEAAPGRTSPQRIDQVLADLSNYHTTIDRGVERIFKEADD